MFRGLGRCFTSAAFGGTGSGTAALLGNPYHVAIDRKTGDYYIVDFYFGVVRKVTVGATGVNNVQKIGDDVNIFPNPVNEELYITSKEPVNVRITDITGRVLIETKAQTSINTSRLVTGMYMVYAYNKEGTIVKVEKVVKE